MVESISDIIAQAGLKYTYYCEYRLAISPGVICSRPKWRILGNSSNFSFGSEHIQYGLTWHTSQRPPHDQQLYMVSIGLVFPARANLEAAVVEKGEAVKQGA